MSPQLIAVVGLLGSAGLVTLLGWRLSGTRVVALLAVLAVAAAATVAALSAPASWESTLFGSPLWAPDQDIRQVQQIGVVALAGLVAVLGGGPIVTAVFSLVDHDGASAGSVRRAAEVLRGGAWLGALERAAVFVSLAAGWPEGIAITLALKGLGRYPELRHQERPGIAERFLIGTFVSVLWAAACAGVVVLALSR